MRLNWMLLGSLRLSAYVHIRSNHDNRRERKQNIYLVRRMEVTILQNCSGMIRGRRDFVHIESISIFFTARTQQQQQKYTKQRNKRTCSDDWFRVCEFDEWNIFRIQMNSPFFFFCSFVLRGRLRTNHTSRRSPHAHKIQKVTALSISIAFLISQIFSVSTRKGCTWIIPLLSIATEQQRTNK